jgi:hypothetical protein
LIFAVFSDTLVWGKLQLARSFSSAPTALLAALCLAAPLPAQHISVGFRGGVPFNDSFQIIDNAAAGTLFKNRPSHWIAGPTFEVRLPAGFGVTLDALYNRLGFESSGQVNSGGRWQFPVMLRYRMGVQPVIKPFLAAGGMFNTVTGLRTPKSSATGIVFGAGLEIKVPFIRIAPELRVSRQFSESVTVGSVRSNLTQAVVLVGVTF